MKNPKKTILSLWSVAAGVLLIFTLVACDDETSGVISASLPVLETVASADDLPECSDNNEGGQAFVKEDASVRVCFDGDWVLPSGKVDTVYVDGKKDTVVIKGGKDTVFVKGSDYSCSTESLEDGSGLKIVCNGDSIGVVLNGAKGEKGDAGEKGDKGETGEKGKTGESGENGVGCSVVEQSDTAVTIKCGDDETKVPVWETLRNNHKRGDAFSGCDSLCGFFLKGSSVIAYELDGSKSILQEGRAFKGSISQDDARFNMDNVTLHSSYVLVSVNGFYRNGVTGEYSESPITLIALTDIDSRNTLSVNFLTHLEYARVAYLMAQGDGTLTIKKLKKKAEHEIISAFHIDTTGVPYSEDLDVFGTSEIDAALLAISILLQGDRNEAELMALLAEISTDIAEDGEWNDTEKKLELAEWARDADKSGRLGEIRERIMKGIGIELPDFEKYIRTFYKAELKD